MAVLMTVSLLQVQAAVAVYYRANMIYIFATRFS